MTKIQDIAQPITAEQLIAARERAKKGVIWKIRQEIERLYKAHSGKHGCDEVGLNLKYIEDFLDTLPEQSMEGIETPTNESEVDIEKEIDNYIESQFDNPEGIGISDEYLVEITHLPVSLFRGMLRHFYELGCRRTAEMYDEIEYNRQRAEESENEDLEEEIAGMYQALFGTDIINRKERLYLETFHNIARHFAEWGAKNAK